MSRPCRLHVLLTEEATGGYTDTFGSAPLSKLARALAASPAWSSMPEAVVIVREAPRPALAVLGRFENDESQARLEALRGQVDQTLHRLRYVDYAQAERDAEALAAKLLERFGRDEVRRFRFVGIPRGGLIVLGMLSYALDLEHAQLEPPHPPEVPLVVVDDCALTGSRFGRFLEGCRSNQVIFAPLYAHPDLRAAIEEEPRVRACLRAQDLHDHAPERQGDEYPAWKERWAERSRGPRYWIGQPDHVCFPWNEPDVGVWNDAAEAVEHGWRVVPPEHCLKNRSLPGSESAVPVQVQPEGKGPLRPAADVFFGRLDGQTVVAHTETQTCFRLDGAAARMWNLIVECDTLDSVQAALREIYDVDEATLDADLQTFVEDLRAKHLLTEERHVSTAAS